MQQRHLNLYVDDAQTGSSIQIGRGEPQANLRVYSDSVQAGSTQQIETLTPRQRSFSQELSNQANSYHEATENGSTSIFQAKPVSGNMNIYSSSPSNLSLIHI